jgi:hypothetical protein
MDVDASAAQSSANDAPPSDDGFAGGSLPGGTTSASAFVDPYFAIAPGTPDADQYSLIFSPGVGNLPLAAVPEPSTWVMLALGFAGVGFAGSRRAQRKTAEFGSITSLE